MYRYNEVASRVDGREVVLYRSENPATAALFKKLVGNRKFHGNDVYQMECATSRQKPTGILAPFVHKKVAA